MSPEITSRKRLDVLLVDKAITKSRKIASDLIKEGKVFVNGKKIDKPSKEFSEDTEIFVTEMPKYVSRAGLKLESALERFSVDVKAKVAIDIGSSTGGFTDCLLQKGASLVYAVDVGTDQLSEELKNDSRVVSMEETDIRQLEKIPQKTNIAVIDVSFISLEKILPSVLNFLRPNAEIIALVKPQFEVGRDNLGKGGIVKDNKIKEDVVLRIENFAKKIGLTVINKMKSPILGGDGNEEFLLYLKN